MATATSITQANASKAARAMYNGNSYVVSDLPNSYMWDTAIVFIQKCSSKTNYSNQTRPSSSKYNTGASSDVVCNIYDMSGNVAEWGTEHSDEEFYNEDTGEYESRPCVRRGGYYRFDDGWTTASRLGDYAGGYGSSSFVGFRVGLYVL